MRTSSIWYAGSAPHRKSFGSGAGTCAEVSSEWGDVGSESKELLGVATTRFTVGRSEISSNSHRPAAVTARAWVSYAALRHYGLTPTQVARELGVSRQSVVRGFERA